MRSMLYYLKYINYSKRDKYVYCSFGASHLYTNNMFRGITELFFKSFKEDYTELISLAMREAHKRDKVSYIGRICYA